MRNRIDGWMALVVFIAPLAVFAEPPQSGNGQSLQDVKALTADQLVADVLDRNRGLDALRAAARAAESAVAREGALPDPVLTGAVAPETVGGYGSSSGRGTNVRVELGQQLPWPGKLDLKEESARFEALAAEEDVAAMRLRLAALTRAAYARWYFVHRALPINAANRELLEQLRGVAENRYAAGLATQQDVLQAEVELQHVRHRDIQLRKERRAVQARINALLNQGVHSPLLPPADKLPAPEKLPALHELWELALAAHPELKGLEQRAAANERREHLADKDFYPDFRVFTGYNSLWDEEAKRWVVGVTINLPIDRRKRRAAVDEARAQGIRILAELDERRAQLLGALEQALATAEEARHTIGLYEAELIPRSEESLGAARAEYGAGGGSFLNVITAQKLLLEARLGLHRARADYFAALAEVKRWTGGELPLVSARMNTSIGAP